MFERNPVGVAIMATALVVYGWVVVDLPMLEKLAALVLALGVFLLAVLALDWLRARYGPDLPADA
jgi:hypothetical protein